MSEDVMQEQPRIEGEHQHEQVEYAGFWVRLGAYTIDAIVLYIPTSLITMAVATMADDPDLAALADALTWIAVWWLYSALLHSSAWQATVGKRLLRLRVTDLYGARISFARATGRYFAGVLSSLIFLIGYIMVGLTKRKTALHDLMAKTYVIRADES